MMTTPIVPTTNTAERQTAKAELTKQKVATAIEQINQGIEVLQNPASTAAQRWEVLVRLLELQKKLIRYIATLD
jgi:hypothetical protein